MCVLSADQVSSVVSRVALEREGGRQGFDPWLRCACLLVSRGTPCCFSLGSYPSFSGTTLPTASFCRIHTATFTASPATGFSRAQQPAAPSPQRPEIPSGNFVAACLCGDNALWTSFPPRLNYGFLASSCKFHRCSITGNFLPCSEPQPNPFSGGLHLSPRGRRLWLPGTALYYTVLILYILYIVHVAYLYFIVYLLYSICLSIIYHSYILNYSLYFLLPNSSFCQLSDIGNNSL